MIRNMRIAFVTGSLVHGGAERHAITLANRLAERGHECHFVYVRDDPSQLGRLRIPSVRCLHARSYLDLRAIGHLQSFLQRMDCHTVLATNPYALMYTAFAAPQIPRVAVLHSTRTRSAKEWLQMLAYRAMFWTSDAAVFVCEKQRQHWRARGLFGRTNHVIYNGVDTGYWIPRQERHDGFVVGMSAVLRPEKNPQQLLDAVAALRRRGIPAKALFIGDGPLRGALEAHASRLGLSGDMLVTGLQEDVRPWLAVCDALAITSFTEAFSLAGVEAMALGLPVVHADVGGAAEMVRHGADGFLFPVGDTAALTDRLAALADPALRMRMGASARAAAETRFSERSMVDRYEQTLTELASKRSPRGHVRKRATAH